MAETPDDPELKMISGGFAKLDSGIVDSSLWVKDHDVLRVWIAALAKCDSYGIVRISPPALAHLCFVTLERVEEILKDFSSPDPHSRTRDHDGRRIRIIEGGFVILNYLRHRELAQRKSGSHAERQARYRRRLKERDAMTRVTASPTVTRDTEADIREKKTIQDSGGSGSSVPVKKEFCLEGEGTGEGEGTRGSAPAKQKNLELTPEEPPKKPPPKPPKKAPKPRFVPPTVEEVEEYAREKGLALGNTPSKFCAYWASYGWRGKQGPMRNWKAAYYNWCVKD